MTASRRAASATCASENNPSSSGPRCAIRRAARPAQSASGLVPSASARHPAIPDIKPLGQPNSLRLEADAAVETDDLRVHVVVLDERADKVPELLRPPEPLREDDRLGPLAREPPRVPPGPHDSPVDGAVDDARA